MQNSDNASESSGQKNDQSAEVGQFDDLESKLDQLWPQVSAPLANRQIAHYQLQRVVGSGAFGVVYLACDTHLKREVALKLPRPEVLLDDQKRQRFESEATLASKLTHPGIVAIYQAELEGPTPYIASEFYDGPDLSEWIIQHGPAEQWQDAVELVAQVAEALDYAHNEGVYHRDLKPANILLSPQQTTDTQPASLVAYEPRIADFGLSKLADANLTDTRSSLLVGTPLYMAPEQIDRSIGNDNPATTDVYSLGVILFELLVGDTPIQGESYLEVLDHIRCNRAKSLPAARADLPKDLQKICKRCLENNPSARYQSAAALARDLRRCIQQEPIEGKSIALWSRLSYWSRRPARINEAGWFTIWVQGLWTIWVVGTDVFIGNSDVNLTDEDWTQIQKDTLIVILTAHLPLAYFGWKTIQGARWGPWGITALTFAILPGLFASLIRQPILFIEVYKGSTTWFVWAVYFMLITCFLFQLAYNICAILAIRNHRQNRTGKGN